MPVAASCRSNEAIQSNIGLMTTLLTLQVPPFCVCVCVCVLQESICHPPKSHAKSPSQRAPALDLLLGMPRHS